MNAFANELKNAILDGDPYIGFDWTKYPDDVSGGEIYPVVEEIMRNIKPNFIIEVGSWKGKSAINMAKLALVHDPEVTILCVDTWLGSDVVHVSDHKSDKTWGIRGLRDHGYSTMYYQFLSNVCRAGLQNNIVPFPNTSTVAAKVLAQQSTLQADVIYIDACHEEDECYIDLKRYWPLLRPGGVMFGDDFEALWYPVICAVNRFANENNLHIMLAHGNKWIIQKAP